MKRILGCAVCAVFAAMLPGQTMVEHSAITAGSTAGAAGMSGVGKAAGKVFEKAGKALGQAGSRGTTTVVTVGRLDDSQPASKVPPPDARAVEIGMTGKQLVSKFGPPAMKVNGENAETWYYGSAPDVLTIELKAGKVCSVAAAEKGGAVKESASMAGAGKKSDTGVVILQ